MILRMPRNTRGRDLIVGDIHGYFTKLLEALAAVGFDPAAGDRLFAVGDLVDRGPESEHVIEWLNKPWFFSVQGNHDEWAVRFVDGEADLHAYMRHGGGWLIGKTPAERMEVADVLRGLPLAIELETAAGLVGIVHAECPLPRWQDLHEALAQGGMRAECVRNSMLWSRDRADRLFDGEVEGVRAVVVGHDPKERWTTLGNVHYIDTGAWIHGKNCPFTILDAATLRPAERPSPLQWEG